ncbi:hypothetical protein NSQ26_14095 [Bacillus sp. FSL W7-1360]
MKAIKGVCVIMVVASLAFVSVGSNGVSEASNPGFSVDASAGDVMPLGPTVPGQA